ncbi:DUF6701 domain-containing protein, partial [Rhodoferax sp.]|uniref:DUF6701 domain-containing protein n=1 Tax=Rhodoferax sp. TaxID=50421 RepID=UPI002725377D
MILAAALWNLPAMAATYTNASTTFNWIDPAAHTKVGYNTAPYKFNGCGTTPPTLDDTISGAIPIGFNFLYGAISYNSLKIESNGRLQFANSNCSAGTQNIGPPQTYTFGYPVSTMNNTMKAFGVDLDPTNKLDIPSYPTTCTNKATCYISYASIGTAPNRQFVVTWKGIPEWVSASKTSGSFDFQIILNENGTFVYQYLSIVHGGTGASQIGWQLSPTDYSVLTFGASTEPTPNSAILFYVASPDPLAEYRFEEGAWSAGGAGQVADATGNGRPGTALGSTQETSIGKICRGASIPANTTAATVDAIKTGVQLSAAGVNMTGQGTMTFWYNSNFGWNAQAAQLIDATQTSGQWFSLTKTASGTLFFEVTDSSGAVRSVETGPQAFAAGAWVHIAISWNFNALPTANSDHLQIFINGAAPATSSFSSSGNVTPTLDYVHVGDNPSGLTGTKGSVNSANGTIDELRFYNFEMIQAQVLGVSSATHACGTFVIDHLELQPAVWSGIACVPGTMTVVACANAACSTFYTSGLIATLSASGAATVWDPAAGGATLVIGAGQASAARNFYAAAGTATMNVTSTGVPVTALNATQCNGVGGSCDWTSANGGLLLTVPDSGIITAGKPAAVSVQAVQSSGATPGANCVLDKNLSGAGLRVWTAPVTPAGFAATSSSASVTVGGPPQIANAPGGSYLTLPLSLPVSDNVTGLSFDSTATTTLWLRHMDTGQFNLNATLYTAATSTAPAVSKAGTASAVAVPVGYGVAAANVTAAFATQTACAGGFSAGCDTSSAGDAKVASAGSHFSATVTAALWTADGDTDLTDNPVAPNYTGAVTLAPILAAPMGGAVGALGTANTTLAAGAKTENQSWTESGALRMSASGTYLLQAVTGQSAVLGRFIPDHFDVTVNSHGTMSAACSSGAYTYTGQAMGYGTAPSLTIKAMNALSMPTVTQNYVGGFQKLTASGVAITVPTEDSLQKGKDGVTKTKLTAAMTPGTLTDSSGTLTYTLAGGDQFTYTRDANALIGAYTGNIPFVVTAVTDGEVSAAGALPTLSPAGASLRYGKLSFSNAHGSELLALP